MPLASRLVRSPLALPLAAVVLMLAVLGPYYLLTLDRSGPMVRDGTGLVAGRDFLNLWFYGRAAWFPDPGRFYDLDTYARAVTAAAGHGYPGQQWSYPPTVLLLAAPFGRLDYLPALALWTVAGVALFMLAMRSWTRDPAAIVAAALSPAGLFGLISGQAAFLAAAALLTGLRWRHDRPALAGVLFGLLTMKPQIGLFVPVLLLAERRWRVIGVAAVVAGLLAALVVLVWGVAPWSQYLANLHHQAMVLTDPERLAVPFMPTVFMNLRGIGASVPVATAAQAGMALLAVAAIAIGMARRPDPSEPAGTALFLAAAVAGSAYLLAYDTLALASMAVLLLARSEGSRSLLLLTWLLPLLQMALGSAHLPGPALVAPLLAVTLLRG